MGRLPALHTRIRRRRLERSLTGTDLAVRAGISTSYVSLIENGAKVPDEEAAARLARALDDDEALYRAWARAARMGVHDLAMLNELDNIVRTPALANLVESGREIPRLGAEPDLEAEAPPPDLATRLREVAFRLHPAAPVESAAAGRAARAADAVVDVPILGRGADPAAATARRESLLLDRRLVGAAGAGALFAYEVADDDLRHLRGVAAPGDLVVLCCGGEPRPDRICAVRAGGRVRLARVLVSEATLVLLPGEGETAFEAVPLPGGELASLIAGIHVLLLRR